MANNSYKDRRIAREIAAREHAEHILEQKSLELYEVNQALLELNKDLGNQVLERSEDLQKSNTRFRRLIETAHDMVFVTDQNGNIIYVNHVATSRYGYNKSDIIGTYFSDYICPKCEEKIVNSIHEVIELKSDNFYIEVPFLSKQKEIFWLGQNLQFSYDYHGNLIETVGIARDITSKKQDEDKLISQELQLRILVENLHEGILFQSGNGTILQINKYFCDFFNLETKPENLVGKNTELIANQITYSLLNSKEIVEGLKNYRRKKLKDVALTKDGRIIEYDVIPIYSDNSLEGVLWQFGEVTEQKKLELQIRNSEEKYRGIIENMELGLMEVDTQGIILRAYEWFCKMTGYTEDELVGRDGKDFLIAPEYVNVLEENHKLRSKGKQSVYEVELIKKNGDRIWVIISGAPFYDLKGKVIGSVGIHFDVTDQKNLQLELIRAKETAERAQEAEQMFLANMSHEIRTPLNAVIGMSHLLNDTQPTEQQKEYLNMIQYSANLLNNLVTEVLDFSKISAGIIELNESEFDINALLHTLHKTFELKAQNKPISISLVKPEVTTLVKGDETILNQILFNLMGNAEKFTEEGAITLRVEHDLDQGWHQLTFHVQDTGIGIPSDQLKKIFDEFNQGNRQTKIKYGGTGLGLAITKNLVNLFDGRIEVKSEEDVGSTFSVMIKLKDTGKPIKILEKRKVNIDSSSRILVVEDNVLNQNYITRLLEIEGLNYEIAGNGQIAFDICQKIVFDIIFMDISMPVMDGYEATIKIRNSSVLNRETPIIALTASALSTKKAKAYDVGMTDYMTKPFTPFELKSRLASYLGHEQKDQIVDKEEHQVQGQSKNVSLDRKVMAMYYDKDKEYAHDMFKMFLKQVDESFAELEKHIRDKNWDKGQKVAHKMKPTFSMVGAPSIQSIFTELENSLRYKNEVQIKINWEQAKSELNSFLPLIKTEFEELKASLH